MKKIISLALVLSLVFAVAAPASAAIDRTKTYTPGLFTDVPDGAWYQNSISDAYELGLMSGDSATTFNPLGYFSLAEAATIAARLHSLSHGGDGVIPRADGAWYQGAVNYCIANGVIGKDEFSNYVRYATRAEMAGILARALPEADLTAVNDVTSIPDVSASTPYSEYIFKFYRAGIVNGSDELGTYHPNDTVIRAEVAAIAARMADPTLRKVTGGYAYYMAQAEAAMNEQDSETAWKWLELASEYDEYDPSLESILLNFDESYWLILVDPDAGESYCARFHIDGRYDAMNVDSGNVFAGTYTYSEDDGLRITSGVAKLAGVAFVIDEDDEDIYFRSASTYRLSGGSGYYEVRPDAASSFDVDAFGGDTDDAE